MRCFATLLCLVAVVLAARVDEDQLPASGSEQDAVASSAAAAASSDDDDSSPDELSDAEKESILRAEAQHGADVIDAHRKADTYQAMASAVKAVHSTQSIADKAKDFALRRAGRHTIKMEKALAKQEDATNSAVEMGMRRDRLIKRADSVSSYKAKCEAHSILTEQDERAKAEMEQLHMESAVAAAHKEREARHNWKAKDADAATALKAKEDSEAKYEDDAEAAKKADYEAGLATTDEQKKAAASKALLQRSQEKTAEWEEADKAWKEAVRVQKEAATHARETSEQAAKSAEEAKKATQEREVALKAHQQDATAEAHAKLNCKLESAVAGQVLDDASAAKEVHEEGVVTNNKAAAAVGKAKVKLAYHAAAVENAHAAVEAAKAAETADAVQADANEPVQVPQ